MKINFAQIIVIKLITSLVAFPAFAGGFTESLYLCDLGIMNSNNLSQKGVDFIQYQEEGKAFDISATQNFSSALTNATNLNSSYDRWNLTNGIENVSINLQSDFYGAQYYLEYCYKWDRVLPSDNFNYNVTFITSLPVAVPNTQFSVDTKCSQKNLSGAVIDTPNSQSTITTNTVTTDFASMRCTVRLNFKENPYFTPRPHNGGLLDINPNITVRVGL